MPKRGSCGAFCRVAASRSNTRRSIHQPSVAALHAPAETPTAPFSVPRYADLARRLVLASRLPSRAVPALNPHSARCLAGAKFPATSCLWRFLDAGQLSARLFRFCRHPKTSTEADVPGSAHYKLGLHLGSRCRHCNRAFARRAISAGARSGSQTPS